LAVGVACSSSKCEAAVDDAFRPLLNRRERDKVIKLRLDLESDDATLVAAARTAVERFKILRQEAAAASAGQNASGPVGEDDGQAPLGEGGDVNTPHPTLMCTRYLKVNVGNLYG